MRNEMAGEVVSISFFSVILNKFSQLFDFLLIKAYHVCREDASRVSELSFVIDAHTVWSK